MNTPTCIYCGKAGPFSDEHVFSAGLGGDDQRFMLKDLVCEQCNTKTFSKLEAKMMRESAPALARIYLQPQGRGSGKKASKPKLNAPVNEMQNPETGYWMESDLGPGGEPFVLPQLIMVPEGISPIGPDLDALQSFIQRLSDILGTQVQIVNKQQADHGHNFMVTTLNWSDDKYEISTEENCTKPPKQAIWIERQSKRPPENEARIFHREGGNIVLRVHSPERAHLWLTYVKLHLPDIQVSQPHKQGKIDQPDMHIGMLHNDDAYMRVLAKIGMNLAIHTYGSDYCRHSAFDNIKGIILTGKPSVVWSIDNASLKSVLSQIGGDHHAMMLAPHKNSDSDYSLLFVIRLYGGPVHVVQLAAGHLPKPPIELPMFFSVNYVSHSIKQIELPELASKDIC